MFGDDYTWSCETWRDNLDAKFSMRMPEDIQWCQEDVAAILRMALAWHEVSDHAKDGSQFMSSFICNCARIAERAYGLGWRDDD